MKRFVVMKLLQRKFPIPRLCVAFCNLLSTRWRSWLRHCAISRKVAVSIPDGVIGIFQ